MDSGAGRWEIALRNRHGHLNPQENFPGARYASGGAGACAGVPVLPGGPAGVPVLPGGPAGVPVLPGGPAGVPVLYWLPPESRFSTGCPRSPGSPVGPGRGGLRSPGSPVALAGEGSGIRGGSSEFRGRPIARSNRIGHLRASVEEFLEFARRGSANGTPLEVDSGGRFSSASGGPPGPPWNFSGRCAGHDD